MGTLRRQLGESNVGCIVGLIVLAIVIVLAIKVVPPRIAVAELQDFCEKEAERAALPGYEDDKIAYNVLHKAQELHLPVTAEKVKVWRNASEVFVEIHYEVPLDLVVKKHTWKVEVKVNRPLIST